MIMCVLLCYPLSIHMSQLLSTGHPISSCFFTYQSNVCIIVHDPEDCPTACRVTTEPHVVKRAYGLPQFPVCVFSELKELWRDVKTFFVN